MSLLWDHFIGQGDLLEALGQEWEAYLKSLAAQWA